MLNETTISTNIELERLPMKNVYLAGYQNNDIDRFIAKIKKVKITTLLDVREIPLSRKKGFSKMQLRDRLQEEGIQYEHIQSLGSPKAIRHELRNTGDYIQFFDKYRAYLKDRHFEIQKIVSMTESETICLMCFEERCELCHRTLLADELQKIRPNLATISV